MPRRSFPRSTTPTTLTAVSNQMTIRSRVMMKLNSFLIDNVGLVAARDLLLRVVCFRSGKPQENRRSKSVRRSLDTAGAIKRDQRFVHLVSQGTVSNCALRDGSDGGGTNANANKN
jgi:hypothetical protein